jgi:hypothetical protein
LEQEQEDRLQELAGRPQCHTKPELVQTVDEDEQLI